AAVRRAIDAAQHPALLYVDTVSGLVSLPFEMDAWGVDAAITGSQKGFMLPAGLGLLGMSRRALAKRESARCARLGAFAVRAGAAVGVGHRERGDGAAGLRRRGRDRRRVPPLRSCVRRRP